MVRRVKKKMKITQFEATGLDKIEAFLKEKELARIGEPDLRLLLRTANVSFVLEGIHRLQSMLICECRDSYVQQSQRYVSLHAKDYHLPTLESADQERAQALVCQSFALYERMSERLPGDFKGRPQPEQYVHRIPIEDARYILPLAAHTNLCVALSGEKFIDLFRLFEDVRYGDLFTGLVKQLQEVLPPLLFRCLIEQSAPYCEPGLAEELYEGYFEKISPFNPMVYLDGFSDLEEKAGFGALTSASSRTPSEEHAYWGEAAREKARGVVQRVLGYGHESIAEQARTTFGMMCSLVTYHQQIRHRLTANYREDLVKIILDKNREVKIPPSIQASEFCDAYLNLAEAFKTFRLQVAKKYGMEKALCFLMNCDQIKLVLSANARADCSMLADRTCLNAQWEIRELAVKKVLLLRELSPVLYEKALPSCVYGACREGKMSCKKTKYVRELFLKI